MILYTLDINEIKFKYLVSSVIVLIFGNVYEYFSHGVISNYMIFAFLFSFVSYLLYLLINKRIIKKLPNNMSNNLFGGSIATLTIYSILHGVLDIYGTTNSKIYLLLIFGIVLLISSIISYLRE